MRRPMADIDCATPSRPAGNSASQAATQARMKNISTEKRNMVRSIKARLPRRTDTEGRERLIVGAPASGVKDQIKFGGNTVDTSKQKPDLMSSNRVMADGGKRILAHLEHGPRAAAKPPRSSGWTIDGWTIG